MSLKSIKKVFAGIALAATLILPMTAKADNGPRFNFLPEDAKTLQGVNRTEAQNDWRASVSGKAGDEFRGLVTIHNGYVNTTAHNTRIKVTIPTQTTNKTATITATISADNAASVTDTMLVTLSEDANIEYIPGKTAWFPPVNGVGTQTPFPNGQTGNEIITTGVNVGDLQGCFQFIQYVSFGFRTFPKEVKNANITVNKTVKNITTGETSFVKSDQARVGDILEYNIEVKNTGTKEAERVVLIDTLPAHVTLINGTTVLIRDGSSVTQGDTITGDGIVICNLKPGETATVTFRVKVNQDAPADSCLVNKATAFFDKLAVEDTAQTRIVKVVIPTPPPVGPALPVSGPASTTVISLATLMAGFVAYFVRKNMIRKTVEYTIARELLNK